MPPRHEGSAGVICSFSENGRWVYGFFARTGDDPAVVVRNDYWNEWETGVRSVPRPTPFALGIQSEDLASVLEDPEMRAATLVHKAVLDIIQEGGLDESSSEVLATEKTLAIVSHQRRMLGWPRSQLTTDAQRAMALDLLPLEVEEIRRRVHAVWGAHFASWESHRAGGDYADRTAATRKARDEAMAGHRFPMPNLTPDDGLPALAEAIDTIGKQRSRIERHIWPSPDHKGANRGLFCEGFTDKQMCAFLESIFAHALREYARIVETNFLARASAFPLYKLLPLLAVIHYVRPEENAPPYDLGGVQYAFVALPAGSESRAVAYLGRDNYPFAFKADSSTARTAKGPVRIVDGPAGTGLESILYQYGRPTRWKGGRQTLLLPVRGWVYRRIEDELKGLAPMVLL